MDILSPIVLPAAPARYSAVAVFTGSAVPVLVELSGVLAGGRNSGVAAEVEQAKSAAALLKAQTRIADSLDLILEKIAELESARNQSLGELQQLAVRLAMTVARSILRCEPEMPGARIESLVTEALSQIGSGPVVVCLNPADLESVQNAHAECFAGRETTFRSDPQLEPGDVRVETATFGLESRIGDQLETIQRNLMERLQDATTERRRAAGDGSQLGRFPNRRTGA